MGAMKELAIQIEDAKERIKRIPVVSAPNHVRCDCCWHSFHKNEMVSYTIEPELRSIIEGAELKLSGMMCANDAECLSRNQQEFI